MAHQSARQTFTAALDTLVAQVQQDRSILAALLCGSLSHDTVWAKSDIDLVLVTIDDSKVAAAIDRALRRRRQRARVPDSARRVPADGRGLGPELVHALAARQGPAALHARRDDRAAVRRAARARRARPGDPAPARGHRSAPGRLQGAQVARHARRPRLHRALDPVRGDVAGPDRSHRRGHGRGSRSHPAGDDAQPRPLRDHLHRPPEHEEEPGERRRGARGGRSLPGRARARRSSRRSSTTFARPAKRARARSSRTTSSGTSTSAR